MKLLVVEDEPKTGEYLRRGLTEAGFVVDLAVNGQDGGHLAVTEAYDLLILDVMLPGMDGWRILQTLRAAGNPVPVLFLTARDQRGRPRQGGWNWALTTTSSSPLPSRSCWRGSGPCSAAALPSCN